MKEKHTYLRFILSQYRILLVFSLVAMASGLFQHDSIAAEPDAITTREVDAGCPLNSGGPSLLNTQWRVETIYGNRIPKALDMTMKVNKNSLTGNSGCNDYNATFQQVGNTGFRVTKIDKGAKGCSLMRPVVGGPTINVGDMEGGFLRTLRRMGSVHQINGKLVFYNRSGNVGIVMTRQ